jgi:hypothetical protein
MKLAETGKVTVLNSMSILDTNTHILAVLKDAFSAADTIVDLAQRQQIRSILRLANELLRKQNREIYMNNLAFLTRERILKQAVRDDLTTRAAHEASIMRQVQLNTFNEDVQPASHIAIQRAANYLQQIDSGILSMVSARDRAS